MPRPPLTVLGLSYRPCAQAALEGADASAPAARTPAKYLGGELRVKSDVGSTSVSMAFAAPAGSDASEFQEN